MLEQAHLSVNSRLEELVTVQQWFRALISQLAEEAPWINDQFDQLNLALAEGFTNAVRHAHANLPRTTPIDIELVLRPEKIEICIFDQGEPFDPDSISEPQPGALREGGYGWFLLRRLADQVTYSRTAASTCQSSSGQSVHLPSHASSSNPSGTSSGTSSGNLSSNPSGRHQPPVAKRLASQPSTHSHLEKQPPSQPRNCLRIVKKSKVV
ncbi:MAG: anti-sigma regulatory factor [Cyanobacteria bacterium J06614_10]